MIETERLILRKWREEDIEPFTKINQDPKVTEFLRGSMDFAAAKLFIQDANEAIEKYNFGLWAATLNETKQLIGYIGLNIPKFEAHFTPCVEIGWRLGFKFWGKGYAPEGAKACLEYGFNKIGLDEIISFTAVGNAKSIRVMEKIRMKRDGNGNFKHPQLSENHPLSEHVLYRIKKSDWQNLR